FARLALGTDTGGSIRQPAALCGVVGLRPTYGRVSRYGIVAYASSLDQAGPFATTVADTALLLEAMWGHDPRDSTSIPSEPEPALARLEEGVAGLRVGVVEELIDVEGIQPEVRGAGEAARNPVEKSGGEGDTVSWPGGGSG